MCHYHGARSTGPRTAEGLARCVAAPLVHGADATSPTYEAALRAAAPHLFDTGGGAPDLARELAFARARLGSLALDPAAPPEATARLLDAVRRLAEAQAAIARDGREAAASASKVPPQEGWRFEMTVIDGRTGEAWNPRAALEGAAAPGGMDPVDPPTDPADPGGPVGDYLAAGDDGPEPLDPDDDPP